MDIYPLVARLSFEVNLQRKRVLVMTSPDPKHELVDLLDQQLCSLEKQVFGVVTDPELRDYEARRDRIVELYKEIVEPPMAA
jgi:hypothetical protein